MKKKFAKFDPFVLHWAVLMLACSLVAAGLGLLVPQVSAFTFRLAQTSASTVTTVFVTAPTSTVSILFAVPEMRVGAPGTNDDVMFYLTARASSTILYTTPIYASTTADGRYISPILMNVVPGTYDIGIKTHQHLTKVLRNVVLDGGTTQLNFSQADYTSLVKGGVTLVAGDINGETTAPALMGDDKVNAIDITTLLNQFNDTDKYARSNLNQDNKVNALDLTMLLKNFNQTGEQ